MNITCHTIIAFAHIAYIHCSFKW